MANMLTSQCRAGGTSPGAPVLAKPVYLKMKIKVHFYKKQVINKVIVWFLDLLGLLYLEKAYQEVRGTRLSTVYAFSSLCSQGILSCVKNLLINRVAVWFLDLLGL